MPSTTIEDAVEATVAEVARRLTHIGTAARALNVSVRVSLHILRGGRVVLDQAGVDLAGALLMVRRQAEIAAEEGHRLIITVAPLFPSLTADSLDY